MIETPNKKFHDSYWWSIIDYAAHFSNGINFATRPLSPNSMNIGEIAIGYVTERIPNEHSFTIQITDKEKEYNQLLYGLNQFMERNYRCFEFKAISTSFNGQFRQNKLTDMRFGQPCMIREWLEDEGIYQWHRGCIVGFRMNFWFT